MPSSSDQTRVGRTPTLGGGAESSLEGRDIELSVSPKDIHTSPYDLCANRSDQRQSREGDRWFESTSLQRQVRCEPNFWGRIPSMARPDVPDALLDRAPGYALRRHSGTRRLRAALCDLYLEGLFRRRAVGHLFFTEIVAHPSALMVNRRRFEIKDSKSTF